jgi:hypothetical protein
MSIQLNYQNPRRRVFSWKADSQMAKTSIPFNEPGSSLTCSQTTTIINILNQFNPVVFQPYFSMNNFNIIPPFIHTSPMWPLKFPVRNFIGISHSQMRVTCPAHLILFDLIILIILCEAHKLWSSSFWKVSLFSCYLVFLGPHILLSSSNFQRTKFLMPFLRDKVFATTVQCVVKQTRNKLRHFEARQFTGTNHRFVCTAHS